MQKLTQHLVKLPKDMFKDFNLILEIKYFNLVCYHSFEHVANTFSQ